MYLLIAVKIDNYKNVTKNNYKQVELLKRDGLITIYTK
jgi:hypothetical protein